MRQLYCVVGCMFALVAGMPPAHSQQGAPVQDFVAPAPGSYALPPIQAAADGWVLEGNWLPRRLSHYTHGALTLLSFVYTYCTDPIGCPLAYATFDTVKRRVLADPALRGRVRLVSLSFDPVNDTPDAMRVYGGEHARSADLPWHFLTTYSTRFLKPILDDFGQAGTVTTSGTRTSCYRITYRGRRIAAGRRSGRRAVGPWEHGRRPTARPRWVP